eukprot:6295011-Prymnesium_polylepis.1
MCSVTRYTGSARGRVLNGVGCNFVQGHHNPTVTGVAFYGGTQRTAWAAHVSPVTDWVVMCGTNAVSDAILVNGQDVGTGTGGTGGCRLGINLGESMPAEASEFAIAELMVWDRGLSTEEMQETSQHLMRN